jgi:hypothetical protein
MDRHGYPYYRLDDTPLLSLLPVTKLIQMGNFIVAGPRNFVTVCDIRLRKSPPRAANFIHLNQFRNTHDINKSC